MTSTAESPLRAQGKGPGHGEVSCSFYRFRPGQDSCKSRGGRQQRKHSQACSEEKWEESGSTSHSPYSGAHTDFYCLIIAPPLFSMGILIQTHAFCGRDVDIVTQTAIQTHAFYGTDVQTVQLLRVLNL